MRTLTLLLLSALSLFARHAIAQQSEKAFDPTQRAFELTLSDETIELRYLRDARGINVDEGQLSFSFFLSENRDVVGTAGLLIPADLDIERVMILFGPRAYASLLEEENNDVLSLAVGAEVHLGILRDYGLAVVASGYYAPDILTFGSADNLTDVLGKVEMRLTPQLVGFAGFRWFRLDLVGGGHRTLQDEVILGVRWHFK